MKIFILGIIYLPESNCVKRISWLTHNDVLTVSTDKTYESLIFFKIWKFNFDKVSTDALTVNLNSAPIYFGSVYTSLYSFCWAKKTV
jgi:hypothetical protein